MNLSGLSENELLARCAWCHCVIPENQERFGTGGRLRPEGKVFLADNQGKVLGMPLVSGREVIAVVTTADSPARAAGHDVYFQICSDKCRAELVEAVRKEMEPPAA
jgi:hypothetical protein